MAVAGVLKMDDTDGILLFKTSTKKINVISEVVELESIRYDHVDVQLRKSFPRRLSKRVAKSIAINADEIMRESHTFIQPTPADQTIKIESVKRRRGHKPRSHQRRNNIKSTNK